MAEIWGAALIAGGAVAGGLIQGNAAKSAANTQAQAAENAAAVQQNMFNTMYGGQQPYMQSGYGAMGNLDYLLGITPQTAQGATLQNPQAQAPYTTPGMGPNGRGDIGGNMRPGPNGSMIPQISGGSQQPQTPGSVQAPGQGPGGYGSLLTPFTADYMQQYSPAYQYQLQQGQQGVLNGASAGDGALSGAAQMGLQQNNQAMANTAFNNAFNQYQTQQGNIYQRLASVAQLGQGAASNQATGASTFAGGIGQSYQNVGTALAGGQVGQANAYAGAMSNAMPWLMQFSGGGGGGGAAFSGYGAGSDAASGFGAG